MGARRRCRKASPSPTRPRRPDSFYDELRVPTLIISGSADRNHPTSFELQKRIKGSELVTIEGAGHATPFERPWEFDAHCIRFLSKLGLWNGPKESGR